MRDDELMTKLARANPARPDAAPDEQLLERLLATPSPTRRRPPSRRPSVRSLIAVAAFAILAAVALASVDAGPSRVSAARAYAAVAPAGHTLLHVKTRTQIVLADGRIADLESTEGWSLGRASRAVITRTVALRNGKPDLRAVGRFESTYAANGVVRYRSPTGRIVERRVPGRRALNVNDPLASFRAAYDRGALRRSGQDGQGEGERDLFSTRSGDLTSIWAVNRRTALPEEIRTELRDLRTGALRSTTTTTIETYERLPVDVQTLRLLEPSGAGVRR